MKKIQKLLALLLAVLMLASVFAGCAKQETPSTDTPSTSTDTSKDAAPAETPDAPAEPASDAAWDTSKKDEIIVSVINGYYTAGEKKLAEEYMKLHPETQVTVDVVADNDSYTLKMQTIFADPSAAGTSDIVHANFFSSIAGGPAAALSSGLLLDMNTILDLEHPYQDGTVRDMFDETVLLESVNTSGGSGMQSLPFDKCGISFYYNKDMFAANGLEAPETWEELLEACKVFREAGIQNPITVSSEATWILASLADAGWRANEYDYLIQPTDGAYDAASMSANDGFVWDPDNLACDVFTVTSAERECIAIMNGSLLSDWSRTAWSEFAKLAQYFPANYIAGGADTVAEFEMQLSPMLVSGSWNVGLLLDDINQMPESAQFNWATFNIPGFENPPEGFESEMRGLYTLGNVMGIVNKGDADHAARVLDFYLFWYSQAGAQLCYEETLSNGNYVQGPAMIKGVTLSDELMEKLQGFIVEGPVKQYASSLIGQDRTTEADRPIYNDLIIKLAAGEIDIDTFVTGMDAVAKAFVETRIEAAGYDLDPATNP